MNTADELEQEQAEYDAHVWAMRHHQQAASRLLPVVRHLREKLEREQAAELRKARKHLGPTAVASEARP